MNAAKARFHVALQAKATMLTSTLKWVKVMGGRRIRSIGRWAACVAAYALALNMMLTSALVASISPVEYNALHQLCLNGVSTAPTADQSEPGKAIIKCPLCLSSAVAAMDMPPQSPALAIRIALHVPYEATEHDDISVRAPTTDHRPRGPPHLS